MTNANRMELFHLESCPYSAKVRDFIEAQGLRDEIDYLDIGDDDGARARLLEMTGDEQVPCLVMDGEAILESDEIIERLRKDRAAA